MALANVDEWASESKINLITYKQNIMANKVTVNIPNMSLGKPDIYIEVKSANEMVGTLTISKSFIEWKSKNKKYGNRKMNWKAFDKMVSDYYGEK